MIDQTGALELTRRLLEQIMGAKQPDWNPHVDDSGGTRQTRGSMDHASGPLQGQRPESKMAVRAKTHAADRSRRTKAAIDAATFRSDKLSVLLADMASRAGFDQVVLSDSAGLSLASYGAPSGGAVLSALAAVLGEALGRVGDLLETDKGESISVDVGYTDKLVLRRFDFASGVFYITVLCGQDVDERSELELSVDEIREILEQG